MAVVVINLHLCLPCGNYWDIVSFQPGIEEGFESCQSWPPQLSLFRHSLNTLCQEIKAFFILGKKY
jgi:hypothetical protein